MAIKSTTALTCTFPGCSQRAVDRHHVTYDEPEEIEHLCRYHHQQITALNRQETIRHKKLSSKARKWVWYHWMQGKLKPELESRELLNAASLIAGIRMQGKPVASSPEVSAVIRESVNLARMVWLEIEWQSSKPADDKTRPGI